MDHSVQSYLQRQPTEILEQLLAEYEGNAPDGPLRDLPDIIRNILLDRQQQP